LAPNRRASGALGRRETLVSGLALAAAFALSSLATHPAQAAPEGGAVAARRFVADLTGKAIAAVVDRSPVAAHNSQRFRDVFVASFDLPAIGELALGRHWRAATPDQRTRFLALFERQQVLIFAGRFRYISSKTMTIDSADAEAAGNWRVPSRVNRAEGRPIPVDWMVAQSRGGWRVNDLAIDGASMAFLLQADFAAVLRSNGENFDALLAAMQDKIAQLSAA
jgi:phospholipid transport system substrate-binding protein